MNKKIVTTFAFGVGIGIAIAVMFSFFPITIKLDDKLPDVYSNFDYSCCFVNPEMAEEVDKSKQPKAWIGYVESVEKEVYEMKLQRNWFPSHVDTRQFFDAYPVVEYVISGRTNAWISPEVASSILEYVNNGSYLGAGGSGHCGQYKYIRQNYLVIPMSKESLAFVFVATGDPARRCDLDPLMEKAYGPLLDTPSIEQRRTFDFGEMNEKLYDFIRTYSLLLGMTPLLFGALIWRGRISRFWIANGFSYSHFELMVKMRGSKTRLEILMALDVPKTRQMIARELNINWKAVDRHVKVLLKNDLIKEVCSIARASYYVRSEKGDKLLDLLNNGYSDNGNNRYGIFGIALLLKPR